MPTIVDLARTIQTWDDISWNTTQSTLSVVDEARALTHWDFLVRQPNEHSLDRLLGLASQSRYDETSLSPVRERLERLRQLSPILPFISRPEALILERLDRSARSPEVPSILTLIALAQDSDVAQGILKRLEQIPHAPTALIQKIRILMERPNLVSTNDLRGAPQPYPLFIVLGNDTTQLDNTSLWMETIRRRFSTRPTATVSPEVRLSDEEKVTRTLASFGFQPYPGEQDWPLTTRRFWVSTTLRGTRQTWLHSAALVNTGEIQLHPDANNAVPLPAELMVALYLQTPQGSLSPTPSEIHSVSIMEKGAPEKIVHTVDIPRQKREPRILVNQAPGQPMSQRDPKKETSSFPRATDRRVGAIGGGGGARSSRAKVTSLSAEAPEWSGDWYGGQSEMDFAFSTGQTMFRH